MADTDNPLINTANLTSGGQKPDFARFKKGALQDAAYWLEANKKRRAAGGGMAVVWLGVIFCLLYIWAASYYLYHVLDYETILDGWAGFLLLGLAFIPAFWLLRKIRKRNRFDLDKAVWQSVWESYARQTAGGEKGFDCGFEASLREKYRPAGQIYRLLAAGEAISDGYKSVWLSADDRLIVADAWDGADDGHEIVEIPTDSIVGLRLSRIGLNAGPGRPGKRRKMTENVAVLEYRDPAAATRQIVFYHMKEPGPLYDLLPRRLFNQSRLRKWFDRFLEV